MPGLSWFDVLCGIVLFAAGMVFERMLEQSLQLEVSDLANGQDDPGYRPTPDTTVITTDDVDATDKYGIDGHSNL